MAPDFPSKYSIEKYSQESVGEYLESELAVESFGSLRPLFHPHLIFHDRFDKKKIYTLQIIAKRLQTIYIHVSI
jgi:hypothetical protein